MTPLQQQPGPRRGVNDTTHWTAVWAAGQANSPRSAAALEELCQTYWYPIYAHVRHRGYAVAEAQDLTQEFFARFIEKRWAAEADPAKGRFRTFLLTALNHFLANEWRKSHAAKRSTDRPLLSLDDTTESRFAREPVNNITPERLYERRWALSLFARALTRLRADHVASGKTKLYETIKSFLTTDAVDGDYARLGKELEMSSGAVAAAVCRLRQHYRELVRQEVLHTVESPADVDDEVRSLLAAISRDPNP